MKTYYDIADLKIYKGDKLRIAWFRLKSWTKNGKKEIHWFLNKSTDMIPVTFNTRYYKITGIVVLGLTIQWLRFIKY